MSSANQVSKWLLLKVPMKSRAGVSIVALQAANIQWFVNIRECMSLNDPRWMGSSTKSLLAFRSGPLRGE